MGRESSAKEGKLWSPTMIIWSWMQAALTHLQCEFFTAVKPAVTAWRPGSKCQLNQPISKATEFSFFSSLNSKAWWSVGALFGLVLPLDGVIAFMMAAYPPSPTGPRKGPKQPEQCENSVETYLMWVYIWNRCVKTLLKLFLLHI